MRSQPDPGHILSICTCAVLQIHALFSESCHFFISRHADSGILMASSPPARRRRWRDGSDVGRLLPDASGVVVLDARAWQPFMAPDERGAYADGRTGGASEEGGAEAVEKCQL